MMFGWGGPGYHFVAMIMMLIFWLLVILGIVFLIAHFSRKSSRVGINEGPADILKRRYAKGELDSEEYARRKKDIED